MNRREFLRWGIGAGLVFALDGILGGADLLAAESGSIILPGKGKVNLKDPIIPNGHFNWGEATRYGERIPDTEEKVGRIIVIARSMEEIRAYFGNKPIDVSSWYRPEGVNSETPGAASDSRHLYGDAVDFKVRGVSASEVYAKLNTFWDGGLGRYKRFTHADRGNNRRWSG